MIAAGNRWRRGKDMTLRRGVSRAESVVPTWRTRYRAAAWSLDADSASEALGRLRSQRRLVHESTLSNAGSMRPPAMNPAELAFPTNIVGFTDSAEVTAGGVAAVHPAGAFTTTGTV